MEKSLPAIPAKRYFTIGEVSDLCGVKPYVLRYWEQEFAQLKPMKRRGNRRYYQHHEVLLIRRIRELLYDQGFTISGARNRLADAPPSADDYAVVEAGDPVAEGLDEIALTPAEEGNEPGQRVPAPSRLAGTEPDAGAADAGPKTVAALRPGATPATAEPEAPARGRQRSQAVLVGLGGGAADDGGSIAPGRAGWGRRATDLTADQIERAVQAVDPALGLVEPLTREAPLSPAALRAELQAIRRLLVV